MKATGDIYLGQRVSIDWRDRLVRKEGGGLSRDDVLRHGAGVRKTWVRMRDKWEHVIEPSEPIHGAIVIGVRTFSNGRSVWYSDEPTEWVGQQWFPVVLVAHDLRRKPEAFLFEDVHPMEEER